MVEMDWIDLAGDRDRWWGILNVAINIRVPLMWGIY
jgi:hypothetical protein